MNSNTHPQGQAVGFQPSYVNSTDELLTSPIGTIDNAALDAIGDEREEHYSFNFPEILFTEPEHGSVECCSGEIGVENPGANDLHESFNRNIRVTTEVKQWGEWDVPLGRSQIVRDFVGNVRYRGLVEQYRPAYLAAARRAEKTRISNLIYASIRAQNGRFLERISNSKGALDCEEWMEISQEKALAKISQALRLGTGKFSAIMQPHFERKDIPPSHEYREQLSYSSDGTPRFKTSPTEKVIVHPSSGSKAGQYKAGQKMGYVYQERQQSYDTTFHEHNRVDFSRQATTPYTQFDDIGVVETTTRAHPQVPAWDPNVTTNLPYSSQHGRPELFRHHSVNELIYRPGDNANFKYSRGKDMMLPVTDDGDDRPDCRTFQVSVINRQCRIEEPRIEFQRRLYERGTLIETHLGGRPNLGVGDDDLITDEPHDIQWFATTPTEELITKPAIFGDYHNPTTSSFGLPFGKQASFHEEQEQEQEEGMLWDAEL